MMQTSLSRAGVMAALLCGFVLGPAAAEDRPTRPAESPSPAAEGQPAGEAPTGARERNDEAEARAGARERNDEAAGTEQELGALEGELAQVMDELVAARARAGVLARALFRTELEVEVIRRADAQRLARIGLRLDGAPVHESDGHALAADRAQLFAGYLAPGMHELAIEVVEAASASAAFGYTRSERFQIEVKKGQRTRVELVLRDDSDMAEEAAEGDEGEYHVETELRVRYGRVHD